MDLVVDLNETGAGNTHLTEQAIRNAAESRLLAVRMFGDSFSSSTSCSRWLHETEPGRLDQPPSCCFLKVATHPSYLIARTRELSTP